MSALWMWVRHPRLEWGVGSRSSDSDLQQLVVMSPLGEMDWRWDGRMGVERCWTLLQPACLLSLNSPGDCYQTVALAGNYVKKRAVFCLPPLTPLAAVGCPGVLFMQAQCFLFMLPSCCGDSVPDQGQIRKKSFSHQNKFTPPLHILSDLFFLLIQTGLCSVISALDPSLMSIDG